MREARADKLGVDCRVVGKGRTNNEVCVVKLLCEFVLQFEALDIISNNPKIGWVIEPVLERSNGFANSISSCDREHGGHVLEE